MTREKYKTTEELIAEIEEKVERLEKMVDQILHTLYNNQILPTLNQYKVIYSKSLNVNGKLKKEGEVFVERDSHEMRTLEEHGFIKKLGEYDD